MPTGSGKTVVFSEICRLVNDKGRNRLILVHRRELVTQASDKLTKAGVEHGIISAGFKPSASLGSGCLCPNARKATSHGCDSDPDLIIIDEAHHAVAGQLRQNHQHFGNARIIGVTATPSRLDGRGLRAISQPLSPDPPLSSSQSKILVIHKVFAPPVIADLNNVKTRAGDYASDQLSEAMNRPTITGDAIAHYRKRADGLPAIAFCCSVAHARIGLCVFQCCWLSRQARHWQHENGGT